MIKKCTVSQFQYARQKFNMSLKNRFYAALKIFILALHWVPPGKALILRSSEILVNYAFHIGLFNMEIILFDIGKNIVYFYEQSKHEFTMYVNICYNGF